MTSAAVMAGMMLPSTLPLLRLDYATTRSRLRVAALVAGYVAVWVAFGCVILAADRLLGMHGPRVTAALLAVAALYQLTPLKRHCLARCRAPLARMLLGWRDGFTGAARMGVTNALWCGGCCAGLMVALVALGFMSWFWMAVVAAAILVEKTTWVGTRPISAGLAAGALAVLL